MRPKIVAGNWKMHLSPDEAQKLTSEIVQMVTDECPAGAVRVVLCPPFVYLPTIKRLSEGSGLAVGAQNCHYEAKGAFTGEIAAPMLAALGVSHVIIGHSERRQYFNEGAEVLTRKLHAALGNGLTPIFCCGEPLEVRENGDYLNFVTSQLTESLFGLDTNELNRIVIAYEPIWAIGTGRTASAEQAQEMHASLRAHLAGKFGQEAAATVPLLYGGSVNAGNARELFAQPDVDGGLVGGASLKSREFTDIIKSF